MENAKQEAKKEMDTKTPTLEERIQSFEKEVENLKEKYQLEQVVNLSFPNYRKYPSDLQLALSVLEKHEGVYLFYYKDKLNG